MDYSVKLSNVNWSNRWAVAVERQDKGKDFIIAKGGEECLRLKCSGFLSYIFSRKVVALKTTDSAGDKHTLYLNIEKLADRLNTKEKTVKNFIKNNDLDAAIGKIQKYRTLVESKTRNVLELLRTEDPSKLANIQPHLSETVKNLYTYSRIVHKRFLDRSSSAPYLLLKKGQEIVPGVRMPLSVEYHGLNENKEPIFYIRYHKNFAQGSFKVCSKMIDTAALSVLVKAKINAEIEYKSELEAHKGAKGLADFMQIERSLEYKKNKKQRFALYSAYQNMGELKSAIDSLTQKNKVDLILQVARGLKEYHAKGYVHRDIKFANLLMKRGPDGSLQIKIADLGLSSEEVPKDKSKLRHGTPKYVAPEIWEFVKTDMNPDRVTRAVDVWALGVICYEMIYYPAPNFGEPMRAIVNGPDRMNVREMFANCVVLPVVNAGEPNYEFKMLMRRMLDCNPVTRITMPEIEVELQRISANIA